MPYGHDENTHITTSYNYCSWLLFLSHLLVVFVHSFNSEALLVLAEIENRVPHKTSANLLKNYLNEMYLFLFFRQMID